ncbi:hypothetical protein IHE45_08G015300 [Dioscorea alata]|uniref:Uncharacterized protein n=1 Tax=Dioscorea alata TaxID=55571 RepID=A0ACB7VHC9_DIOAL|nr:hypothetical protein IHE45_08G015300 [Dioscorea alata]
MSFFIPENTTSSSTTTTNNTNNTNSTNIPIIQSHEHKEEGEDDERLVSIRRAVSTQLFLRSDQSQRSLDKDVVLRRLRHRKRVNRLKNVFQSFIRVLPENNKDHATNDHHVHSWLAHDVFSSP